VFEGGGSLIVTCLKDETKYNKIINILSHFGEVKTENITLKDFLSETKGMVDYVARLKYVVVKKSPGLINVHN